jgi:hypothetical protein
MNSLPFISHQLFVAAIGNDGRGTPRPTRHDRLPGGPTEPGNVIGLEVMDDPRPLPAGATRPGRAMIAQPRS